VKVTILRRILRSSGSRLGGRFFLTFDDGPDPKGSPALLDVLERHGAKASFFWVGEKIEQYPWLCRDTLARGHMGCNHTFSHVRLKGVSLRQIKTEIEATDAILRSYSAPGDLPVRPPYGEIGLRLILYAFQNGRKLVLWSLDPEDFQALNSEAIENFFERSPIKAGDIVLLHEDAKHTIQALDSVLSSALARGLSTATLDELWPESPKPNRKPPGTRGV
jgi:peptidoglycan-N-acetylglucosamine deacetylase